MDPKAKIDEMLRRKRAESQAEERRQEIQPPPPVPPHQHGNEMDRINAMLKQKQARSDEAIQPTQPVATPPQEQVQLPFGLCRCCDPRAGLVGTEEGQILCPASRNEYVRNIDGTVVPRPPELNLQSTNSIEAALNEGNAAFYYGGFMGGQNEEQRPRRRRRR